jgi:NAD-dependent SIR2 family protein deacetylase
MDATVLTHAAQAVRRARAVVVTAGAGMGVDSGLPDFRGVQGFWRAYPFFARLGLSFEQAANPRHFAEDPALGWGFYGHRANLYRTAAPHDGFGLMRSWAERLDLDLFVVTSNVDGHFQKAGYPEDRIWEVHGSIHHLQCAAPCGSTLWPNREQLQVDESTMRADRVPRCPQCGGVARPNILMFDDWSFVADRSETQRGRFDEFLRRHRTDDMVVIELGAGTAVATIRGIGERLGHRPGTTLVRVNPREPDVGPPHLSLACGAREGLLGIDAALRASGSIAEPSPT